MSCVRDEIGWILLTAVFLVQAVAGGVLAVRLWQGRGVRVLGRKYLLPRIVAKVVVAGPGLGALTVAGAWLVMLRFFGFDSVWQMALFALAVGIGYFVCVTVDHATDPRTNALPLHSAFVTLYRLGGVVLVGVVLAARA